jgi:hypothetical protein
MLTRTVAAFALLLAASTAAGCKPDRSRPLPLSDAGADTAAEPGAGAGGARSPVASGGGEKAAPARTADAGTGEKPAAEPEEPKAEPGDEPATGSGADGKTAGVDQGKGGDRPVKKPRNVKALPGSWSTRQVTDYMKKQVARGLGAECDHCHDTSDFAADDNKHKQAARAMMRMNAELNRLYFRGKQVVTCFTCHQGKPEPARKK